MGIRYSKGWISLFNDTHFVLVKISGNGTLDYKFGNTYDDLKEYVYEAKVYRV